MIHIAKKSSLTTDGHTDSQLLAQKDARLAYFCLIEGGFTHEIDGRQKGPSQIKTLLLIGIGGTVSCWWQPNPHPFNFVCDFFLTSCFLCAGRR